MIDLRQPLTRRQAVRLLGGTSLALAAGGLMAAKPAAAGRAWCRTDPEIRVNGKLAHIYVASYEEMHALATAPTEVVVSVPRGTATEFLWADTGFGGLGYNVQFVEDATLKTGKDGLAEVVAKIYVPCSDGDMPVLLELTLDATKHTLVQTQGKARNWQTVKGWI